jgi:ABC-type Fe2+-enterobactin transport system substrate-binding protein
VKRATFIVTIDSYHDVSVARLLLHASRALDQQAKAEGLTTAELIDGNLAQASVRGFHDIVDIEADAIAKPIHFNLGGAPR